MPTFTPSLSIWLVVFVLISRIQVATAACSNMIHLTYMLDSPAGYGTEYKQKLDFVSCPSSLNRTCQILPKDYTITVPTQLNISKTQTFPSPDAINTSSISRQRDDSYIFNTSTYSLDVQTIFRLVRGYFASQVMNQPSAVLAVETPLTIVVSTLDNSTQRISGSGNSINLTARPGYNLTLYYNPFMVFSWGRFSGCDNQSLNGFPISTIMPYFTQVSSASPNSLVLAGMFLVEQTSLNGTVVVDQKSLGSRRKSWSGWSIASMALGVSGFVLL